MFRERRERRQVARRRSAGTGVYTSVHEDSLAPKRYIHVPGLIRAPARRRARCRAQQLAGASALARLETRIALADHENLAATAHDLAVAMPLFRGLQGRKHLHGGLLDDNSGTGKPESVAGAKA